MSSTGELYGSVGIGSSTGPAADLGADLAALVRGVGVPLRSVRELTRRRGPDRRRAAFCLEFVDGTRLKGRRLFTASHARRVAGLMRAARDPALPRVVGQRGAAMLLDWIDGETPADGTVSGTALEAAASLLARLHARPVPAAGEPRLALDEVRARLASHARELADCGALPWEELRRCQGLAEAGPRRAEVRVVHGDLCGENLVVTPAGRWWVVDNESLAVGYAAWDLARTATRWSLAPSDCQAFLGAYARAPAAPVACALDELRSHFDFWWAAVLAESAAYRRAGSGSRPGAEDEPLAALRRHLRSLARGETPAAEVLGPGPRA